MTVLRLFTDITRRPRPLLGALQGHWPTAVPDRWSATCWYIVADTIEEVYPSSGGIGTLDRNTAPLRASSAIIPYDWKSIRPSPLSFFFLFLFPSEYICISIRICSAFRRLSILTITTDRNTLFTGAVTGVMWVDLALCKNAEREMVSGPSEWNVGRANMLRQSIPSPYNYIDIEL